MYHKDHLRFLQQKIQELGSAIFFNQSESVLKLPTSLISSPKADDFGFVWFWVSKPRQNVAAFENGFPVRLDFYRKGCSSFLKISGTAWIVTDPEEMHALPLGGGAGLAHSDMVPVKVKMLRAEYHEAAQPQKQSWWSSKSSQLASFFRQPHGRYAASHNYFPVS